MSYKPPRKMTGEGYGPSGLGKIEVNSTKTKVRVSIKDKEGAVTSYELSRSDCPDVLPTGAPWYVQLSNDKKKLMSVRPWEGTFTVHTQKFAAKENEPPVPKLKELEKFSYWYFTVILEVVDGDEKGMTLPLLLNYWFTETQEEVAGTMRSVVAIEWHSKSKYFEIFSDYLDVSGVWDAGPMPYKDNVLPLIEKRVINADKKFKIVIKNGFPVSILGGGSSTHGFEPEVEK